MLTSKGTEVAHKIWAAYHVVDYLLKMIAFVVWQQICYSESWKGLFQALGWNFERLAVSTWHRDRVIKQIWCIPLSTMSLPDMEKTYAETNLFRNEGLSLAPFLFSFSFWKIKLLALKTGKRWCLYSIPFKELLQNNLDVSRMTNGLNP